MHHSDALYRAESKIRYNRVEKVLPEIPQALSAAREHCGPVGKLGCAGIALIEPGAKRMPSGFHGVASTRRDSAFRSPTRSAAPPLLVREILRSKRRRSSFIAVSSACPVSEPTRSSMAATAAAPKASALRHVFFRAGFPPVRPFLSMRPIPATARQTGRRSGALSLVSSSRTGKARVASALSAQGHRGFCSGRLRSRVSPFIFSRRHAV